MTQKWAFFMIGAMAGVIAILGFALFMNAYPINAHATSTPASLPQDSDKESGIIMTSGGSGQNLNDIVWVLYRHENKDAKESGSGNTVAESLFNKKHYLSLACYQVGNNGRYVRLVAVRNVSWDMDLLELKNEKPRVADIVKALRDQEKKKKKNKKKP